MDGSIRGYAVIDTTDVEYVGQWRWHLSSKGYAARIADAGERPRTILLHRILLGLTYGDGLEGDHKDRDKLNCRRSNLRIVTHAGNMQNHPGFGGSSEHRGVSWRNDGRKWLAQITINGRNTYIGRYDTEQQAAEAAHAARIRLMPFSTD